MKEKIKLVLVIEQKKLDRVMDGDLDDIITALKKEDELRKLQGEESDS